jgi:hypothetical protein
MAGQLTGWHPKSPDFVELSAGTPGVGALFYVTLNYYFRRYGEKSCTGKGAVVYTWRL